jgi:methionyl-tRNA formyltransferase
MGSIWTDWLQQLHAPADNITHFFLIHCIADGRSVRVKLLELCMVPPSLDGQSHASLPGSVVFVGDELIVYCREGAIQIQSLCLEGKPAIKAKHFRNGYGNKQNLSFH